MQGRKGRSQRNEIRQNCHQIIYEQLPILGAGFKANSYIKKCIKMEERGRHSLCDEKQKGEKAKV